MNNEDREKIQTEINRLEEDQKLDSRSCIHLLRITNLQNKLKWDDYLRNGISPEDKKIFDGINHR